MVFPIRYVAYHSLHGFQDVAKTVEETAEEMEEATQPLQLLLLPLLLPLLLLLELLQPLVLDPDPAQTATSNPSTTTLPRPPVESTKANKLEPLLSTTQTI